MIVRTGISAALVLAMVILRRPLEASPITHLLMQLPLLALAGVVLASALPIGRGDWNRGGWACLIISICGIAFWMLPRSIDASLSDPAWELGKFFSLTLLVGFPLRLGWTRAHPLLRGFLKAQAISMLAVLAFLYTHAPVRLCNAYLAEDQQRLGLDFLVLALALAAVWVAPMLFARTQQAARISAQEKKPLPSPKPSCITPAIRQSDPHRWAWHYRR